MEFNIWYLVAAVIVGILFPGIAILNGKKTRDMILMDPVKKIYVLRLTAIQLIFLTVLILIPFWINQTSISTIGLGFVNNPFWVIGLFVISLLGLWLMSKMKLTKESVQKVLKQNERLMYLAPSNNKEYQTMIMVSFVAGISEEIIYRGFLLWFFTEHFHLIPAILLANLPFGLAHVTSTGVKNSLQAFLLALIFTAAFLLTESLWLSILLHILVDLYSSTLFYKSSLIMSSDKEPFPDNQEVNSA